CRDGTDAHLFHVTGHSPFRNDDACLTQQGGDFRTAIPGFGLRVNPSDFPFDAGLSLFLWRFWSLQPLIISSLLHTEDFAHLLYTKFVPVFDDEGVYYFWLFVKIRIAVLNILFFFFRCCI